MTKDEIFEEIRDRLTEALLDTVDNPWRYADEELDRAARAALRYLRVIGVTTDAVIDEDGVLDPEPTEAVGMLLAYRVASELLSGDLRKRLLDGEMGLSFRMGADFIDTKTMANSLQASGEECDAKFKQLCAIVLSGQYSATNMFFGGPTTSFEQ